MSKKISLSVLLCSPDHYRVDYVINPWMKPGSVDVVQAKHQWQTLVDTLVSLDVDVKVIPQDPRFPDMVFATDQGWIDGQQVILSNLCFQERKGESLIYQRWFEDHGYTVKSLGETCFEGGECSPMGNKLFLGTGFRASSAAVPKLQQHVSQQVIPLELIKANFYHLDTCFLPINDTTAFYYPSAFSSESQMILQTEVSQLLEFTEAEAYGFAANSFAIGQKMLIAKPNVTFARKLRDLGIEPIELDISEFIKAGGGIHCLILPL